MRNLFAATLALAMALTLSCSLNSGSDEQSYKYCVMANNICLTGPFTASTCSGQLSNSCTDSSDPIGGGGQVGKGNDIKNYNIIKIGNQIWMAENLNYNVSGSKCYGEGGKVYNEKTREYDIALSNAEIQANCAKYGRLYNWATARTVCPSGWHLPSDAEWTTLTDYVGGASIAGTRLKAKSGWNSYSGVPSGTDNYGFSALPGGLGYSGGGFISVGNIGNWWSATENDANNAYSRDIYYSYEGVLKYNDDESYLFSVRCVQN